MEEILSPLNTSFDEPADAGQWCYFNPQQQYEAKTAEVSYRFCFECGEILKHLAEHEYETVIQQIVHTEVQISKKGKERLLRELNNRGAREVKRRRLQSEGTGSVESHSPASSVTSSASLSPSTSSSCSSMPYRQDDATWNGSEANPNFFEPLSTPSGHNWVIVSEEDFPPNDENWEDGDMVAMVDTMEGTCLLEPLPHPTAYEDDSASEVDENETIDVGDYRGLPAEQPSTSQPVDQQLTSMDRRMILANLGPWRNAYIKVPSIDMEINAIRKAFAHGTAIRRNPTRCARPQKSLKEEHPRLNTTVHR